MSPIWLIMRSEIDFHAAQAKREIHEMTVQAAKDLGCLKEYQRLHWPEPFRQEILDAFEKARWKW